MTRADKSIFRATLTALTGSGLRLLLLVWLTILLVAIALIFNVWADRQEHTRNSGAHALSLVRLIEQHADSTIDRTNLALLAASDALIPADYAGAKSMDDRRRKAIEAALRTVHERTTGVVSMSITDAEGYVFANSVGVAPGRSLGDRKYFLALKSAPSARPVISEAIFGRVSSKWGVQIARRIDFPDGRFAGMIVANLGLTENFEHFYRDINLGPDSVITLRDGEGNLLVRYPPLLASLGKPVGGEVTRLITEGTSEALVSSISPLDGIDRLVAMRKVPDYPIYAVVGLSKKLILSGWYGDVQAMLLMFVLVLLGGGWITREILVRQRVESDLLQASAVAERSTRTKTNFLAAASHDLRQPLQALSLFVSALGRTRLDEDQRRITTHLAEAVRIQGEMLNTLLDVSRLDAGAVSPSLQPIKVFDLLRKIDAEFSPAFLDRQLRFKLHLPVRDVWISSDPQLLLSMLRNVLGNALKYTERGGVLLSARPRGDRVLIQVWDTGIGIARPHLDQIYDEYFQISNPERDRSRGLGLGLSIVWRLARLVGAEIDCHSRVGQGTVFSISLPATEGTPTQLTLAETERHTPLDPAGWIGRRIVIIENDAIVGDALKLALSGLGMRPEVFSDPLAAIEASDQPADFYISDFRLPGANDGLEIMKRIEARVGRPISGILLTGDTSPERIQRTRAAPWPVLYKPVNLAILLAAMAKVDLKRAEAAGPQIESF